MCLIGASGCGKSTILNLVAGLDTPTAGRVDVGGRVAMMFQESALFPWLTVAANVELPMRLAGVSRAVRKARARELISTVHLDGFADKRPHQLSGGMRQRAALARAFAQDADILLMDEPFGALDAMTRDVLHEELDALVRVAEPDGAVRDAQRSRGGPARGSHRRHVAPPRSGHRPVRRRHRAASTHRFGGRGDARRHRDRSPTRGRAGPCSPLTPTPSSRPTRCSTTAPRSPPRRPRRRRITARAVWLAVWPKVAAVAIGLAIWQLVVWSGWRPEYVLPPPATVFRRLGELIADGTVGSALVTTLERVVRTGSRSPS